MSALRDAIEAADATALRALLRSDPGLAEADVVWGEDGKNRVPALHFVCDAVFRGLATEDESVALADALLEAGVDLARRYARSGDTYLIAAASLGAERVGLRLLEHGAEVNARGLFDATALHWAAFMGLEALARALFEHGSELEPRDSQYDCTPLEWAVHGWTAGTPGRRAGLAAVVATLRAAGASPGGILESALDADEDAAMRAALGIARE